MEVLACNERTLTELDHVRLARLVRHLGDATPSALASFVDDVLDASHVVSSRDVLPDIVTMNSQVELADLATGQRHRLTVCYPADAQPALGAVSVLSPVGAALIGQRVGSIARWQTPNGKEVAAKVEALLFQPEASGDYTS
ncbi:MAG TPA: GreA/GreB family elongation factor [Rhizobacter sp.]